MNYHKLGALVGIVALGGLVVACGDDDKPAAKATTTVASVTTVKPSTTAASAVKVDKAWARTSPAAATMGAAYMTLTSPTDDKLVSASADASIAKKVEIHEMVMATPMGSMPAKPAGSMPSTATTAPMMKMQPVKSIDLPAGKAVELKPGGYHIMFIDLVKPLEKGQTIKVTLTLEKAGAVVVDVPVLDAAP